MLNKPFYTIKEIVAPDGILPICRSFWLKGVEKGKFPKPIKKHCFGNRLLWKREDLQTLLDSVDKNTD